MSMEFKAEKSEKKQLTEEDIIKLSAERDAGLVAWHLKIASYITLANAKDIELIQKNRELDKALSRLEELSDKTERLEREVTSLREKERELSEQVTFLGRRAAPVVRLEKTIFGRALKKLIHLFRRDK